MNANHLTPAFIAIVVLFLLTARAEPPTRPVLSPWAMPWGNDIPGVMSAAKLLDAPAGKAGPVVARDGHFFSGERRIRFFGANVAFAGALPSHEQADKISRRLAQFGINCIRIHHIDNQPFPNGILADRTGEKFSPEGLDRLDYFIAAMKAQGVYTDLNLHVSRDWGRAHKWPNADKMPGYDKMVDLFNPELIAANKQYARDLLTHVNPYTKTRLADESAIALVEINNEDTLFLWGGERQLAELPQPYAGQLQKHWNEWLAKKYGSREKLKEAWSQGTQPPGENLLKDPAFEKVGQGAWYVEQHDSAKLRASPDKEDAGHVGAVALDVSAVDGTSWHLQFNRAGLTLKKGQYYSLQFDAAASEAVDMTIGVQQAHAPWQSLGLGDTVALTRDWKTYRMALVCPDVEANAKVSFSVGRKALRIRLANVQLREGGQLALADAEDPQKSSVSSGGPRQGATAPRSRDWYDFLQQTDEAHFIEMRRFLRDEIGVKCPITGTIGLGPLGTCSQSKMDFVDAHAYWDHPHFPHRAWDSRDWLIQNKPMVDNPAGATLWGLAATRVEGKPFTVTEYNHASPNEWQAECMPMIATYAALQDWDGIFLFAYSHNNNYEKTHTDSFFDMEGNPVQMGQAALASRIFLGGAVKPLRNLRVVAPRRERMLDTGSAYFYQQWPYLRDVEQVPWVQALYGRVGVSFDGKPQSVLYHSAETRIHWSPQESAPYSGQFMLEDEHAAVFVGFARKSYAINLGGVAIGKLETPFASIMLVPDEPGETLENASRLLLSAVARQSSTGMQWDANRRTVGDHWGAAPPLIEVVTASVSIRSAKTLTVFALTPEGKRGAKIPVRMENGKANFEIGSEKTIWYELVRE